MRSPSLSTWYGLLAVTLITTAVAALGLSLSPGAAAAASAVPPTTMVGNSCNIAASNDATTISTSTASTVTFKLRCRWSGPEHATHAYFQSRGMEPFTGGCIVSADCRLTPTLISYYFYSGSSSEAPFTRHGGGSSGGPSCNVASGSFTRTIDDAERVGVWSWRCSSVSNTFTGSASLENAVLTTGTSFAAGIAMCGHGHGDVDHSHASNTDWMGSCDRVPYASIETADTEYSWSPASPCSVWDIHMDEYQQAILPGATVLAESSASVGTPGEFPQPDPRTYGAVRYRLDPAQDWQDMVRNPTAGGAEAAWNVTNTLDRIVYAQNVEFYCRDLGLNGEEFFYTVLGEQLDHPNLPRPCGGLVITWPTEPNVASGDEAVIGFNLPNEEWNGDIAGFDLRFKGDADNVITVAVVNGSADAITIRNTLGVDLGYPISAPAAGLITFTAGTPSNILDWELVCHDSAGLRRFPGGDVGDGLLAVKLPPTPAGRSLSDCAKTEGLGISPASWLKFAINSTGCVGGYMFIPSQSALDSIAGTYEDSAVDALFGPVAASATGFTQLATVTGTCEGDPISLPLGGGESKTLNFLDACAGPANTARNVSWWVSRLTIMLAFGFFLRRTAMGLVGAAEDHYGTF